MDENERRAAAREQRRNEEGLESPAESDVHDDEDERSLFDGVGDDDDEISSSSDDLRWRHYPSDDDSGDEDFDDAIYAETFQEAADYLEESDGGPIERLCVLPPLLEDLEEELGEEFEEAIRQENDAASFRRFVAALGRRQERGGRAVRQIHFDNVDWDVLREEDLARFFGEVLPAHPTIETIGLAGYEIPQSYVRLLLASIGTGSSATPLRTLLLQCAIGRDTIPAVADMIRRNAPLSELRVDPLTGPELDADDCRRICQSALRNTHIRVLHLRAKDVSADTLDDVVAHSTLTKLVVSADEWSDECVTRVTKQLRANTTLERLYVIKRKDEDPSPFFRPLAHVLETYNVTLRKVGLRWFIPQKAEHVMEERVLTGLRRRNRLIRQAIDQLEPRSYHVVPATLLPRMLGMASPLPTVLYRFLRKGDLNTLCDLLRPRGSARGPKRVREQSKAAAVDV
jgi:hypothetical protein